MDKRIILDSALLNITIKRMCYQLVENHGDFKNSVILGLQSKGVYLADKIAKLLESGFDIKVPIGYLDTTFNRDDFRRRQLDLQPSVMHVPFSLEEKNIILVDDVLYTGRSVRAALDAMLAYGRPASVELLILIDRKYTRELPIEPKYCGKHVNTLLTEKVLVELTEQGAAKDNVWLITN
ncbi:MAG: bifunctional pyr operon transcriptional regulator/uracil phosphoribosyltransferase PyrR [Bacteroidetes bacterium]|nr:MAG: bifunctional pyr operon transcriptional regulator/uracil phosphoribosyltransferase PyrR [Bacteroidota bacterium]